MERLRVKARAASHGAAGIIARPNTEERDKSMGSAMPLPPFEFAAPTRQGAGKRQGLGLVNRAGYRAGKAIGGGRADLDSVAKICDLPRVSGRR